MSETILAKFQEANIAGEFIANKTRRASPLRSKEPTPIEIDSLEARRATVASISLKNV
jgi:hypothetical protein